MLIPYKWLKDYVDIRMQPEELAHRLTMSGLEVSSVHYLLEDSELEGVVVGLIEDIFPHPYGDNLLVCLLDIGETKLRIVCGAPNVDTGQKVLVAKDGAVLPSGDRIKSAPIKQVESEGMICSARELQVDNELLSEEKQEGILTLPEDIEVGASAVEALGKDDIVFELDLTPNRADCMSIINIAREIAAISGSVFKYPDITLNEDPDTDIDEMISIRIDDEDLCGRYVGRAVENVKIGPSPNWLQNRLKAADVRPINNIVDVTNFVMLETGQPLHAFDFRLLDGQKIIVRRAYKDEKITTLDGQERILEPNMLVIADAEKPVAIAGIMGGQNSEVLEDTSTILIESANFNPINIRRSSKKLNLKSESSVRFEKGVDIEGTLRAANRAAQLMAELGGGTVVKGAVDNYPGKWVPKKINLRVNKVGELLGLDISSDKVKQLLGSINLKVENADGNSFIVTVPSFRGDLEREIDLVEEVARLYGYDKIPATIPGGDIGQEKKNREQIFEEKCKNILSFCGLTEVITFSFTNSKVFDMLKVKSDSFLRNAVEISNPLSEDQGIMRTTIIPNLLEIAQRNSNRKERNLSIFEFGRVFFPSKDKEQPEETPVVSGLTMGKAIKGWNWEEEEMDFFFLKGILQELFGHLNIKDVAWKKSGEYSGLHPVRTAEINVNGRVLGIIGEVHPYVVESFQLPSRAYVFELNFETLIEMASETKTYKPLPKFPTAERDIAVIVSEEVRAEQIEGIIKEVGGELLKKCRVFDVYRGEQIPEGKKSVAYSLIYQAEDRTLTDEEVDTRHQKIRDAVVDALGADLR